MSRRCSKVAASTTARYQCFGPPGSVALRTRREHSIARVRPLRTNHFSRFVLPTKVHQQSFSVEARACFGQQDPMTCTSLRAVGTVAESRQYVAWSPTWRVLVSVTASRLCRLVEAALLSRWTWAIRYSAAPHPKQSGPLCRSLTWTARARSHATHLAGAVAYMRELNRVE